MKLSTLMQRQMEEEASEYLIEPSRLPFMYTTRGDFKAGFTKGAQLMQEEMIQQLDWLAMALKVEMGERGTRIGHEALAAYNELKKGLSNDQR